MTKRDLPKNGFTLVELMLVTAILAVIGVVLYGTFTNGINIWKRTTQETAVEDINLFFEKISYDLRNSFKMTGMRFRGEQNKVSFPARIKYSGEDGVERSIGQVTYSYNRRKKTLNRNEANYSEVFKKKPGSDRLLANDISSLRFRYFIYDINQKKYSWVTKWQEQDEPFGTVVEETLPLIVKIEVGISKEKGEQKFVKTVQIPSGCCWPYIDEQQ